MSDHETSTSPSRANKKGHRPPEVDKFVDQFLSTMCESSRRQILELLAEPNMDENDYTLERRSSDIARELGLSPATTSEHLKQLTEAGLLACRREGTAIYYRIRNYLLVKAFNELIEALHKEHASHLLDMSKLTDEGVS